MVPNHQIIEKSVTWLHGSMESRDIILKDVGCVHKGLHIARGVCRLVLVESMGEIVEEALRL